MMEMHDSQPGPPEESNTVRRDMEFVRRGQMRWKDGYSARMSEEQPQRPTGRTDQHASLAHMAEGRCPKDEHCATPGGFQFASRPIPAHERERWIAGYLHADALIVRHGRTKVSSDPTHVKRAPREVAPTVEMFPEAVLSKEEVRARKAASKRPTYGDAGEQT